ncbi:MAG: thermonuclease family protein [Alphaproteobacteria bacterium]
MEMRIVRIGFAAALIAAGTVFFAVPAMARDLPTRNPEPVEAARVVAVTDGDTISTETGAEVRLTGIQAPKLPLGRPGFRAWPLAERAKQTLARLALEKTARLEYRGRKIDRWGRLLADVYVGQTWLQREMVKLGMARVYTFADNRAGAAALYDAERRARAAKTGIWALDWYRILSPADLADRIGTFQIVEAAPVSAALVRGQGFINFGDDWRTDFTISTPRTKMKLFRAAGVKIEHYQGKRLRVRGWLIRRNGPMITVTHPEQIEVVSK